ncbi:MAG TPA: YkvA family protein, partial [Dyadobacter sp.]|nr:YkvA family protein [Dyadobacter sp.]
LFFFKMNNESLLTKVLKSVFFRNAQGKAGKYAGNTSRMMGLATDVVKKLQVVGFREGLSEFSKNVQLLIRLIRATANGSYKGLPWKSLLSVIAVLLYFVSPIDIIPDFLPVIGIADDVALVFWLFRTIASDIAKFSEWEKHEKIIKIG